METSRNACHILLALYSFCLLWPQCQPGFSFGNWCCARLCTRVTVRPCVAEHACNLRTWEAEAAVPSMSSRLAWCMPQVFGQQARRSCFTKTNKQATASFLLVLRTWWYYVGNVSLATVRLSTKTQTYTSNQGSVAPQWKAASWLAAEGSRLACWRWWGMWGNAATLGLRWWHPYKWRVRIQAHTILHTFSPQP